MTVDIMPPTSVIPLLRAISTGSEVSSVIAGGEFVVKDRKFVKCDLDGILHQAQQAADQMSMNASEQFWKINGKNAQYMRNGQL